MSQSELKENTKKILELWRNDPLTGIRSLFGVEPDEQQRELIRAFGSGNRVRVAVKSCQGGGKTSCLTWLAFLSLLTLPDCRILITSPSYNQLSRVFYTEMLKWHSKMHPLFKDSFEITKETLFLKSNKSQIANLVTANPANLESLQGGHSENYIIFADEASGIDSGIYETLLGTLGVGNTKFIATSNPIKSTGFFYDIFDKGIKGWKKFTFTAKRSGMITPEWIQEMADTYGIDSDAYAIRVMGEFGKLSEEQFIPTDVVKNATMADLDLSAYHNYPKVCGVDIARFGVDTTVFLTRQGPKLLDIVAYRGLNTMEVARKLVEYRNKINPAMIYVDGIGVGGGVVDRCKELGLPIKEVIVSHKATDPIKYFNLRSQLWGEVKDWLMYGADIPDLDELRKDLVGMTYDYTNKLQIQLTSKKDMKRRGEDSPDYGDALALTMAEKIYGNMVASMKPRRVRRTNHLWV
jgi:phage terminase large subunit